MEQGTEYFWEIIIKTDKYEQINYYARVMVTDKEFVTEQIKFAKNFAKTALKGEGASKLAQYIEPDSSFLMITLVRLLLSQVTIALFGLHLSLSLYLI